MTLPEQQPGDAAATLPLRHALALGIMHGPAELLPISSSGHVALVPWLLGWPYERLEPGARKTFEVALHAGTAIALLVTLRGEVARGLRELDGRRALLLALSFAPPALLGLALEKPIERHLGTPATIAAALVAGSLAMAGADRRGGRSRSHADADWRDGLGLGIAQACALVPGVSRNGATLALARLRGFDRPDANLLSRHCALPVIVGAAALKGARARRDPGPTGLRTRLALGAGGAFVSTLASGRLIAPTAHNRSPVPYAVYRVALAAVALARLGLARPRGRSGAPPRGRSGAPPDGGPAGRASRPYTILARRARIRTGSDPVAAPESLR